MLPATRPDGATTARSERDRSALRQDDGGGDSRHAHRPPVGKAVGQAVHLQPLDPPVEKPRYPGDPGPGKIRRRLPGGVVADQHTRQGQLVRGDAPREQEKRLPAEVEALDLHLHRRQGQANAPQAQTVEQPPLDLSGRRS